MGKMIYLDNAATTKTAPEVVQAMMPYFSEYYGNPSSIYDFAGKSKEAITRGREQIAEVLGAKKEEIYFTAGGSESDNWALKATYDAYKSSCKAFTNYLKENSPEVKNINDVDEGHVIKFIQSRAEEGYSPSTYSKDMAALNKIFNTEVTKSDCDVANRSYKTIENNRELKPHHEKINFDNYKSEISMIQATGIRRSSLETITKDSFKYDTNGTPTHICVTEKGGRYREAEIRESYREEIREIVEKAGNERVFEHIPNRLPTHRFRQEYAEKLYEEKLEKIENTEDREQYRGYDREILREVSENLGHNREDVIVYHYLYVR